MDITMHGDPLTTNGTAPAVDQTLPNFQLTAATGETVTPKDWQGQATLISVVPDINTSVCSIQTKHFNQSMDAFPDIRFVTVSTNTTEQQQNWCAAEGVDRIQLLSDAQHSFGSALGLYVADKNILARSIFIIDATGKILYRELIQEQTHEPDYQKALAFLKSL